jgi:hypothetical protein
MAAESTAKEAREQALQRALKAPPEAAPAGGVQLKASATERITHLRLSGDSRRAFETLATVAELNVIFAYDFHPRPLSLDLTNVTIEEALRAAVEAHVFWEPVTPNTIVIVRDSPTNRRMYEQDVVKTVHLSNPLAPADRTHGAAAGA